MKKLLVLLLAALLLAGCGETPPVETEAPETTQAAVPSESTEASAETTVPALPGETLIVLSDDGITVDGGGETDSVFTSHDIIYYEDRDSYPSGNPYGEGTDSDRHSPEEAAAHTVVNITSPGIYRLNGSLSKGQIRVDLGKKSKKDPERTVTLILDGVSITCDVAPALLFDRLYECDHERKEENASPDVNTSDAGVNLVLEGENFVNGSHVAKIYKDKEGKKTEAKQDGAICSAVSMNISGTGSLDVTADNEGIGTDRHLTVNSGNLIVRAADDGINASTTGISVITVNGGTLHIMGGLGEGGDGIDSNGFIVINDGTVVASAHMTRDGGLDSELATYINGGTVLSLSTVIDWAHEDSDQPVLNLSFANAQAPNATLAVTDPDGNLILAYDPSADPVLGENLRPYSGAVLSSPALKTGETYSLTVGGQLTDGTLSGGTQMEYTGNIVSHDMPGTVIRPENSPRTDLIMDKTVCAFTGLRPAS